MLGAGSALLSIAVAQPLVRRFSALGRGEMARLLLVFDAVQIVGLLAFAFAGAFAAAVAAWWATRLVRSLAAPVYSTWLNSNIDESSVRATVISITNLGDSLGEWGGGPALGGVGKGFGIRAALAGSAVVPVPALALYWPAVRHHDREPELVAAVEA